MNKAVVLLLTFTALLGSNVSGMHKQHTDDRQLLKKSSPRGGAQHSPLKNRKNGRSKSGESNHEYRPKISNGDKQAAKLAEWIRSRSNDSLNQ